MKYLIATFCLLLCLSGDPVQMHAATFQFVTNRHSANADEKLALRRYAAIMQTTLATPTCQPQPSESTPICYSGLSVLSPITCPQLGSSAAFGSTGVARGDYPERTEPAGGHPPRSEGA